MNYAPGIKFHLFILGFAPAVISVICLVLYFAHAQIRDLENGLRERGRLIARQVATASAVGICARNEQTLQSLANAALEDKNVTKIKISDLTGTLKIIAPHPTTTVPTHPSKHGQDVLITFDIIALTDENWQNSNASQTYAKPIIGQVDLYLSSAQIYSSKVAILKNSFIIFILALLLIFLFANKIGRKISVPIFALIKILKSLTKGNLEVRTNYKGVSELEDLHTGFNALANTLGKNQAQMERKIYLATARLQKTLRSLEEQNLQLKEARRLADTQNKVKSQFLAHVSHEIRTPMNGIMGFTELLKKSELTAEQLDKLQLIDSSAQNLLSIINDILDLSKLESGKFALNIIEFDLRSYLEDAVSLLCPQSIDIDIILCMDPDFPKSIKGDPIRLQQVITNLLGNALKFTQQGRIVLRARLLDSQGARSLFLSVSDTGCGIAENDQNDLFSPFLQLSDFAVEHYQGTGLGLTISKNIVERMQGYIGVASRPLRGSTFWIVLPIEHGPPGHKKLINLSVVLIHENRLPRYAFESQLTALGVEIRSYDSVESFIRKSPSDDINKTPIIYYLPSASTPNMVKDSLAKLIRRGDQPILLAGTNKQSDLLNLCHQSDTGSYLVLPCRSTFLLNTLKSSIKDGIDSATYSYPSIENHPNLSSRTFLVADDNEINRILLKSQLLQSQAVVLEAKNGKESLELLNSVAFDLIFLDLQMPVINGMDIMRYLKTNNNVNAETPVIAVTAHALPNQLSTVLEVGFADCLIKPLLQNKLKDTLKRWIPDCTTNQEYFPVDHETQPTEFVLRILKKTNGDKDLASTLMAKLFNEIPSQLASIEREIGASNNVAARQATHMLHGSAAFCEIEGIQKYASKLETALSQDSSACSIDENFTCLKRESENLLRAKEKILENLNQPHKDN